MNINLVILKMWDFVQLYRITEHLYIEKYVYEMLYLQGRIFVRVHHRFEDFGQLGHYHSAELGGVVGHGHGWFQSKQQNLGDRKKFHYQV